MKRRTRIILGVLILAVSIALLVWAYKPLDRITNTQPISPSDLQLPTPISYLIQPSPALVASGASVVTAQDKPITVT